MADKVRWGILSTAGHGKNTVIPAIQAASNAEVVAVASRDKERASVFAERIGIPKAYGSYEDLLADPSIEAIYIPLPNHLHKPWAIRAAQAGKHVLCEKPIALNAQEAEEMVQVFADAGLKLAEAFQWRHHPQGLQLREMVRQGAIGEMRFIDAGFSFMLTDADNVRWDPAMGGGALYDVGCYPISFTRFIAEAEPVAVTGQIRWHSSGIDDLAVATMEFPGGVFAHINCSFALPLRRYYEVVGTEGSIASNHTYNPKGDIPVELVKLGPDRIAQERITLPPQNSYVLMAEDFCRAVRGEADLRYPPEDAVKNMRVIDAIFKSAREGVRVEL
jgi:predicted dehydrogenase